MNVGFEKVAWRGEIRPEDGCAWTASMDSVEQEQGTVISEDDGLTTEKGACGSDLLVPVEVMPVDASHVARNPIHCQERKDLEL